MGIPLLKVGLTVVRYTLRPINNLIIQRARSVDHNGRGYVFFVWFGNHCNHFETHLNRLIIGKKGLGQIPDLHPEMAFHKGIDYFTEIFFFYGIVFTIAFYEMAKSIAATNFAKET
jgi:hypothetical protein